MDAWLKVLYPFLNLIACFCVAAQSCVLQQLATVVVLRMTNDKKRSRLEMDISADEAAPVCPASPEPPAAALGSQTRVKINDIFLSPVRRLISQWEWPTMLNSNRNGEQGLRSGACVSRLASATPPKKFKFSSPTTCTNNYFLNQPIKNILFEIYYKSNRHDTKSLVLDAFVIFFEQVYDDQRKQIFERHDYRALIEVVAEIRGKLVRNYTIWRERQCYGLFIEKLFIQMTPKCPPDVLLALFADDLFELGSEEIVLLRQLFPRILRNLNAAYLSSSICGQTSKEVFDCLLLRLGDMACDDTDREIQRLALETIAKFEESDV